LVVLLVVLSVALSSSLSLSLSVGVASAKRRQLNNLPLKLNSLLSKWA